MVTSILDSRFHKPVTSGSSGVPEAPIDGTPYVRQDASWVPESANIDGGNAGTVYLVSQKVDGGHA